MVGVFIPDLGVFGAIIYDDIHHHSAGRISSLVRALACPIYFVALDEAPLSARSPVAIEIIERIFCMRLRMLLPIRIMHPDPVSPVVILLLHCLKEVTHDALLRPIAEPPG